MYTEFFGLDETPFALVPDPKYMFMGRSHREAFAHLLYGIEQGEGFIAIVGQVGTGKTTLCRTLLARLVADTEIAYIFNPSQTEIELLQAVNRELGLRARGSTRGELLDELNYFLLEKYAVGRRVLLVIDEAQNLGPAVLEQLRLLSNLETERGKLLQIVLLGQPELEQSLGRADLRQLRQRITLRWRLGPFERDEVADYLEHRLRVAGLSGPSPFTRRAARAMYRVSRGIPRVVNAVADRALLGAFARGRARIGARAVRRAWAELPAARRPRRAARPWALGAAVAGLALVAALGAAVAWPPVLDGLRAPVDVAAALATVGPQERLRAPDVGASAAAALGELLAAWGHSAELPERVEPHELPAVVRERSPLLVFSANLSLQRLASLDVPSMLELEVGSGERRYAAVLRLDAERAWLGLDGRAVAVERAELLRGWSGRAFLLWRNFESLPALAPGMRGSAVRWLQVRLSELGYLGAGDASGEFDALTEAAVRRFQSRHSLDPTGALDTETLIALYQRLGYGAPHLSAARDGS